MRIEDLVTMSVRQTGREQRRRCLPYTKPRSRSLAFEYHAFAIYDKLDQCHMKKLWQSQSFKVEKRFL